MRILRLVVAFLVALYAVKSALPAGSTLAYKMGWLAVTPEARTYVPLMAATTWPQLIGWSTSIGLYLFSALSLVTRNGRAFLTYACAVVVDLMFFFSVKAAGIYDKTFTAQERMLDWVLLGLLIVVGAVIFLIERRDRRMSGYA